MRGAAAYTSAASYDGSCSRDAGARKAGYCDARHELGLPGRQMSGDRSHHLPKPSAPTAGRANLADCLHGVLAWDLV
jgi:hypothetical protein